MQPLKTQIYAFIASYITCFGRKEFLKNARVRDIRVVDMLVIKVSAV